MAQSAALEVCDWWFPMHCEIEMQPHSLPSMVAQNYCGHNPVLWPTFIFPWNSWCSPVGIASLFLLFTHNFLGYCLLPCHFLSRHSSFSSPPTCIHFHPQYHYTLLSLLYFWWDPLQTCLLRELKFSSSIFTSAKQCSGYGNTSHNVTWGRGDLRPAHEAEVNGSLLSPRILLVGLN